MKNFKDLEFKSRDFGGLTHRGGFGAIAKIGNHTISVQCGDMAYCTPRENLKSVEDYFSFEIAIWEGDDLSFGAWVTRDFVEDCDEDVAGWIGRDQINKIIELLNQS